MTTKGRAAAGSAARRARADRILDAAAELLQAHGYRRVSIDDVAERARIGKGTIYLHWKSREALFWAALQRDAMRLLTDTVDQLRDDAGLAMPHRLMPAIFIAVTKRPLIKAMVLSDTAVLGALAADESVAAAQRELAGNPDYLQLLAEHGLLRKGLGVESAGYILGSVMRGFFLDPDPDDDIAAPALSLERRADLLADVMARTLEIDPPAPAAAVEALRKQVSDMFTGIAAIQRAQLERAY